MKIERITSFSESDFQAARALLPQLSDILPIMGRETFKRVVSSPATHLFFIRTDEKQVAGMLSIALYDVPGGRRAYIEDVVVDSSLRGKGLGKALVSHAICYAEQQGADTIMLTSSPHRVAANELYRALGFELKTTNAYVLRLKG